MKDEKKWGIALLALGLAFLAMVLATTFVPANLKDQQKANAATLADLEKELAPYNTDDSESEDTEELTSEEEETIKSSAAEAGKQVAECQNKYMTLTSKENREEYEANVEAMDALLSDSSKDARVRWYDSETPGTWSFITNGEFSGDTLGVLWLCENPDDGSMVGYATGTYDAKTNTFSNIHYGLSSEAAANRPYESNGVEDDGQLTIDDLPIDEVGDVDTSDIPDSSEEDVNNASSYREQLKEKLGQ